MVSFRDTFCFWNFFVVTVSNLSLIENKRLHSIEQTIFRMFVVKNIDLLLLIMNHDYYCYCVDKPAKSRPRSSFSRTPVRHTIEFICFPSSNYKVDHHFTSCEKRRFNDILQFQFVSFQSNSLEIQTIKKGRLITNPCPIEHKGNFDVLLIAQSNSSLPKNLGIISFSIFLTQCNYF